MDKEQFDELILTIINGFETLNNSIKNIKIEAVDIPNTKVYDEDDLTGIPLNSVHHPRNPDYTGSKSHYWDEKVKMWRRKQ